MVAEVEHRAQCGSRLRHRADVDEIEEDAAERGRRGDGDGDRGNAGAGERDERPDPDASADEPRHAFRVDEDLAHLQPRHERRRHAGSVALQELDQVEMRADGDDQLGSLLVREQERDVLGDARRGDPW